MHESIENKHSDLLKLIKCKWGPFLEVRLNGKMSNHNFPGPPFLFLEATFLHISTVLLYICPGKSEIWSKVNNQALTLTGQK